MVNKDTPAEDVNLSIAAPIKDSKFSKIFGLVTQI